ncbi:protein of unknown function [Tenacibaculum sp. 190524A02b]|uniref:hypothetical protein n=1 Tax=Tenacibaculum vairaonense TaxID=3137860 RepID=UPI0032B12358
MVNIDLYIEWLLKFKSENKISYTRLGEAIKYSDVGISKAIKNKTISINQVLIISEKFNAQKDLEKYVSENKNFQLPIEVNNKFDNITDDELSLYILKNKDRILNNEVIKIWIEKLAIEKAKEFLKREIKLKI